MKCTLGSLLATVILAAGLVNAQSEPDSKLVQYLRDAQKSGQQPSQAQQRAISAGWTAAEVSDAAALVYGESKKPVALNAKAQEHAAGAPEAAAEAKGKTPNMSPAADPGTAGAAPTVAPHIPYEYKIGAGDSLLISVWKEPEASGAVVVRPDGMISTPLIKEIQVAGLTPTEAQKVITERLVKLIQEPDVTVVVTGMASKKIYAIGGVKKEGPIPYTYSMTIMQAISEAGGLSDYAKRKKIYVLRVVDGKENRFTFNYDDALKGTHIEQNIVMLPGDTLVVPQ